MKLFFLRIVSTGHLFQGTFLNIQERILSVHDLSFLFQPSI